MNRRQFLRSTSAVALGLTTLETHALSASLPSSSLVDVNVSLGRWPSRRLPLDETSRLAARLRRHGVTQAWAGSFDAVFGSDLAAANANLAAACRKQGHEWLLPFGSVNLARTDWEHEFHRCVTEHQMRGLRLHPNYHGYKLNDPAFARLLALADSHGLVVQLALALEDERVQSARTRAPHVDVTPLLTLLKTPAGARVMLLNWHRAVSLERVRQLAALGVCLDIATLENVGGVASLVAQIPSGRIVFGSHAPFFYFEAALLKLQESDLPPGQLDAIRELTARRLLA